MSGSRLRATLAYDGSAYAGWQVQPDRPTIQGTVEAALQTLLGTPVAVFGSGRTDAGVHALGQVAHFDDPRGMAPERLRAALNGRLPGDIRVLELSRATADFHARRDAIRKTYFYQLHLVPRVRGLRAAQAELPPWRRHSFLAVEGGIDVGAMRAASRHLAGTRDFTALSKVMDGHRTTIRTVHSLRVLPMPGGLRIFVTGSGFLYGMVRLMAGLLLEVGRGRRSVGAVPALLAAADRSRAPPMLPAHGLVLWRVEYGRTAERAAACYAGVTDPAHTETSRA